MMYKNCDAIIWLSYCSFIKKTKTKKQIQKLYIDSILSISMRTYNNFDGIYIMLWWIEFSFLKIENVHILFLTYSKGIFG
jgi:hypothetical protein